MRQRPDSGGTLDIIEIDVIDADPSAFGDSSGTGGPARQRRPRPRWLTPVAVAVCSASAVGVIAWQPWDVPPQWRTFETSAPTIATLSNLLLPSEPPGPVLVVVEPDTVGSNTPTTAPGYVFAEPGATFGFRRAAMFEATPTNAANAAAATEEERAADAPTVHGIPANVERFRLRNDIEWGPLDGATWRAFTTGLDEQETLAFTSAVGAPSGVAALRHDYSLDGLVPLGSVSAFNSASSLRNELSGGHLSSALSPTMVTYVLDETTEVRRELHVASVPAPADAMQLVGYVFGAGEATTVHGLPAQLIDAREVGPMIIWFEGGRLISVAGPQTDERLHAIAESVAPVSADAWLNAVSPVLEYYIPIGTWPENSAPIVVGDGVTDTGVGWRVEVTIGNPTVTCVYIGVRDGAVAEVAADAGTSTITSGTFRVVTIDTATGAPPDDGRSMCTFSTPRVPATREFSGAVPGVTFVVAILPIEEFRLVLRVTSADGTITDYEPVRLNDEFTGVAVAVDPGATYSLVDPSA
ncbi:MAG: hypothetical protein ABMA25_04790 [Ilumatobacteraceae bacterium]